MLPAKPWLAPFSASLLMPGHTRHRLTAGVAGGTARRKQLRSSLAANALDLPSKPDDEKRGNAPFSALRRSASELFVP